MERGETTPDLLWENSDVAIRRRENDAPAFELMEIGARGEGRRDARRGDGGVVDPVGAVDDGHARVFHAERFEGILSRKGRRRVDAKRDAVSGSREPKMRD